MFVNQDVGGFHIAMDHSIIMTFAYCLEKLYDDKIKQNKDNVSIPKQWAFVKNKNPYHKQEQLSDLFLFCERIFFSG